MRTTPAGKGVNCVYEIVIDGLNLNAITTAMRTGITAASREHLIAISAGNYGGKLGKIRLDLLEIMTQED